MIYGTFNSDKPTLHDDARMVVLELGGLESRPLSAYRGDVLIDYLHREQDVSSPRWPEKLNVIDEG